MKKMINNKNEIFKLTNYIFKKKIKIFLYNYMDNHDLLDNKR